jgi:exonuclease-1
MKLVTLKKLEQKSIWVLDGKSEQLKDKTKELRKESRELHEKAMEASLLENNMSEAIYHCKASVRMTAKYHDDIRTLFDLTGTPWTQAEGEADHKMAILFKSGKVDGVLSEDSDLLAHGVNKLYRPKSMGCKFA